MKKNKFLTTILIISLLFISLLILSSNTIEKFQAITPTSQVYDIIIVAGQSNAIGSGRRNVCDSTSLPGCTAVDLRRDSSRSRAITSIPNSYDSTNSRIKQFSSENTTVVANRNKIIDMKEPLQHFSQRTEASVSFTFHFAKEYLARRSMGSRQVLIVGCAWSGTSIFPAGGVFWKKPTARDNLTNSLYHKTVQRLRNVKNQLAPTNNSKVVAFLWHQGESDMRYATSSEANKTAYKSALKESLTGMRTEIMSIFNNNNSGYRYPILLGGLSYDKEFNRITGVRDTTQFREAMSQVISEVSNPSDPNYIPKSTFVSSNRIDEGGFNRRLEGNTRMDASGNNLEFDDNNHFSATANREFGKRYYYKYSLII
jgi:hypothetical protein